MIAYCWRNGRIDFGRKVVVGLARQAYDGKTLLVPGVPEAEDETKALDAVRVFEKRVRDSIARRIAR